MLQNQQISPQTTIGSSRRARAIVYGIETKLDGISTKRRGIFPKDGLIFLSSTLCGNLFDE